MSHRGKLVITQHIFRIFAHIYARICVDVRPCVSQILMHGHPSGPVPLGWVGGVYYEQSFKCFCFFSLPLLNIWEGLLQLFYGTDYSPTGFSMTTWCWAGYSGLPRISIGAHTDLPCPQRALLALLANTVLKGWAANCNLSWHNMKYQQLWCRSW